MVDQLPPIKTLELDKICRVCLTVKKDMRPLFGEMIAELLMECARIQVMTPTANCYNVLCILFHELNIVQFCLAFSSKMKEKYDHCLNYKSLTQFFNKIPSFI